MVQIDQVMKMDKIMKLEDKIKNRINDLSWKNNFLERERRLTEFWINKILIEELTKLLG